MKKIMKKSELGVTPRRTEMPSWTGRDCVCETEKEQEKERVRVPWGDMRKQEVSYNKSVETWRAG